jgi:peroxiredoxin
VNLDKDRKAADKFHAEQKPGFPLVSDTKFKAAEAYGVKSIPTNVAIDKDGVVVAVVVGADEAEIGAAVNKAAAKK